MDQESLSRCCLLGPDLQRLYRSHDMPGERIRDSRRRQGLVDLPLAARRRYYNAIRRLDPNNHAATELVGDGAPRSLRQRP